MRQLHSTVIFNCDLKRLLKRGKNIKTIQAIVNMLVNNIALPQKYRPHKLIGYHYPKWACHIEPN
ncbi:hypothetical protein A1C_03890 [Rickettsia akari str. Hartford]|uniref:Uncharacterized protein n=1 Tax=Rickettsia akari (strain Hartford) TaxID=293614 RepID=A8GNS6_RICAH|nr:hypothetical protein A1C_03890 [Rickettsia akari str. Hartford]